MSHHIVEQYAASRCRGKMERYSVSFIFIISIIVGLQGKLMKNVNPPHCTQVTKSTDYQAKYNYDYPAVYIPPGQREAYQHLFCINPPMVNSEVTVVCDWAAPPQVEFTLGDEYMHVVRVDPTGRYLGNVVIKTSQRCSHKQMVNGSSSVDVTELLYELPELP